jgi:hypothetical protein
VLLHIYEILIALGLAMSANGSCTVIYNVCNMNWILRNSCTYILGISHGKVSCGFCAMMDKSTWL